MTKWNWLRESGAYGVLKAKPGMEKPDMLDYYYEMKGFRRILNSAAYSEAERRYKTGKISTMNTFKIKEYGNLCR